MKKLLQSLFILLFVATAAFGQNRTITGTVTSKEDGLPLPGVSVKVRGTNIGVSTGANGKFSISVPSSSTALEFSSIGYGMQTVVLTSSDVVNASLDVDSKSLNEVVVTTGYTTINRRAFSGATASVSSAEVAKQTFGSFDQALQGAATGVSVVANGGQPGQNAVVRIRGNGSISGNNVPLYIMDGIEISAADFQTMNQGDFESIEVLKDAVSTGIYGSRGANGVIVITTKKGKVGQVQINYDLQVGRSKMPEDRLIVMNSQQKIDYELRNGNPYDWTDEQADSLRAVNFNWQDALFQTGATQQHQISASAGSENSKVYGSLSFLDQDGIVKTTGLKRYTARLNLDNKVNNFRFGLGLQGGFSNRNNTLEGDAVTNMPLNAIRWSNPYEVDRLPDGSYNNFNGNLYSGQPNGAMELFENKRNTKQIKGIGTAYLEYHLPAVQGLYARTNWGVDYTQNEGDTYISPITSTGFARQGSLIRSMNRNFRYTGTSSLNYKNTFDKHEINGGVFFEVVKNDYRTFGFTGFGLDNGFGNETGITAGSAANENYIPTVTGNGNQTGLMSVFTSLNYGYDGKYFINAVLRRDGSSRFGLDRRWANFGSIGATWAIDREEFVKNISFLSQLNLRVSYGTSGNQPINEYSLSQLTKTAYAGVTGWTPSIAGNQLLTWETNKTFNVGLDFGFFKNRLSGTLEYYNRLAVDQFYNVPVDPSVSGFTTVPGNFGDLRNRGVEFTLRGDVLKTTDFVWNLSANISYNRNEVVSLPVNDRIVGETILSEGSPRNTFFLVPYVGVDPATGNALYRKLDGTITPDFDANDKVKMGTSDAPWFGGFTTKFSYKGFDLSAQVNFFLDRVMYNADLVNLTRPDYFYDNLAAEMLNEWTPTNTNTNVPRFDASNGNEFQAETSRFLENASFWRLRNVTLGYTFRPSLLSSLKIKSARVFVQGQNLWTSTKFRSFDPEATGSVLAGAQYPSLVQGTFGLSIGF
ncbi:SusC/RagA family TonB-linked outer membrane protein [Pedobacter xixiisoli]|uniref:TonB-linked outer membrane protein, SusC/RagA family n=1 Tax=Pedobacter xixiisoli TaxID=1476464 RepID=A0A286ADQ9_9SPHI|nr:TonB-dependent receptor [Pedobacter xixiisoli]SOD20046.1 TonB-linked outer membrane protein, SusC/RagA family [Pedobacter xixiisoli]